MEFVAYGVKIVLGLSGDERFSLRPGLAARGRGGEVSVRCAACSITPDEYNTPRVLGLLTFS